MCVPDPLSKILKSVPPVPVSNICEAVESLLIKSILPPPPPPDEAIVMSIRSAPTLSLIVNPTFEPSMKFNVCRSPMSVPFLSTTVTGNAHLSPSVDPESEVSTVPSAPTGNSSGGVESVVPTIREPVSIGWSAEIGTSKAIAETFKRPVTLLMSAGRTSPVTSSTPSIEGTRLSSR